MTPPDEAKELEEMALLTEMARPLVHECNNFLNNLLLQLAISEPALSEPLRTDWERVQQDGKRLAGLLHQWQRQRRDSTGGAGKADIQSILKEIVAEQINAGESSVHLVLKAAGEPLAPAHSASKLKRLCRLVLRHAGDSLEAEGKSRCTLEIQIACAGSAVTIQFCQPGPAPASVDWAEFDAAHDSAGHPCLLVAACKSLTERIGGNIGVEKCGSDRYALVLKLPSFVKYNAQCRE